VTQQRRWLVWAALAYLGVLVATATGLGSLYRASREHLDEALGLRLQAAATAAVHLVDSDAVATWAYDPQESTDLIWLTSRLEQIQADNDLAEVTLCDRDGFVLSSAGGRLERRAENVFWNLDRPAVELAREGLPSISHLYRSGDLYQKSAHAPVRDRHGEVVAVLTVEGNADFFQALRTLRHGAWFTMAAVLIFLAAMGALLLAIHRSLASARTSLARQEHLATMGRMTAGIAHEIRNPLGIIHGSAQHLQRVLRDHGIEDEVAAFIPEEVDRLDRILSGYLAFGREDEGVQDAVELDSIVRRTVMLTADEFQAGDINLELTPPPPDSTVLVDPPRIQQVLLNVLLNARDASPPGSTVTAGTERRGDDVVITISDQGRGLEPAQLARAFDPFWTTKDKGSGLGLAVSRRIARDHGGDLDLSSRHPGPGCVATLSLPAAPARKA